jgi:hypothetical protein
VLSRTYDLYAQGAGTGAGRAWIRIETSGRVVTFIGGAGLTVLAPSGTIQPDTNYEIRLLHDTRDGTLTLFLNDVMYTPVARQQESADGNFYIGTGHLGTDVTSAGGVFWDASLNILSNNVIPLIIIAGQSNAQGQCGEGAPSELSSDFMHRFGYSIDGGTTVNDNALLSDIDTRWGVELEIGRRLQGDFKKVAILKVTNGSTSLGVHWKPAGSMYNEFVAQYAATKAALELDGYTVVPSAFIWIHGESDSNDASYAADYLTNYNAMRQGFENDVGLLQSVKTIITETPLKDGLPRDYQSVVDNHKLTISNQHGNAYIDTSDLTIQVDGTHYNSDSLVILGHRCYDAMNVGETSTFYVYNYPLTPSPDLLNIQDTSGNDNHAAVNVGTGDAETMAYSNKQNVYNRLLEYGGSKWITFTGAGNIASAHLIGSETVTSSVGTSTPTVAAGQVNLTAGTLQYLELSDGTIWRSANAYPDGATDLVTDSSVAKNTGTITGGNFTWDNALDDGSETVDGQTITNVGARYRTKLIHNNFDGFIKQPAGNEASLGHSGLFYEIDGITPKEVSFADGKAWISGTDNTWTNFNPEDGTCYWDESLIYAESKSFDIDEYNRNKSTLPNECGGGVIEPLYDSNNELIYDSNNEVIYVLPEGS